LSSKSLVRCFLTQKKIILFFRRKLSADESVVSDETEDLERRQENFQEYFKSLDAIRQYRNDEKTLRLNEKTRQLEEYVDLQDKINQIRRQVNEPREVYRQRFLEIERQRLAILAAEQQRLLEEEQAKAAAAAALVKPKKKKGSAGKKKK